MKFGYYLLFVLLVSCSPDRNTIKIKGSDTEVNLAVLLAESFHKKHPEIFVSISGGGSGLGIASLLNGTADVANSSRSINEEEIRLFQRRDAHVDSFVFAQDAIAFVVAADLPIDSIKTSDLAKILNGEYANWSSLGIADEPINIYGRQSNSGTHDFVKKKLGIEFTLYAKQMNGNAQILEAIKADHSGIGYVGAGYVSHRNSKELKVIPVYESDTDRAVSPLDADMIAKGKYFFQRPLFQYYKLASYSQIKPFLDFEKSTTGRQIIKSSGYYPAKYSYDH